MNNIAMTPLDDPGRTWNSATERFAEHRRLVSIVATTYLACQDTEPVVAFNPDPAPEGHSPRWSPVVAEFIADVELAVRRTLEKKPEADRKVLNDAWTRLLNDDTKIDVAQRRLIGVLAPAFFRRDLHPALYFKRRRLMRRTTI